MPIQSVYDGEDVPITVDYTDPDTGDPQATDVAPTVTITDEDDTEVVSSTAMTSTGTGSYEYVWDVSGANGPGVYTVVVTAEVSSETKISRGEITVLATT